MSTNDNDPTDDPITTTRRGAMAAGASFPFAFWDDWSMFSDEEETEYDLLRILNAESPVSEGITQLDFGDNLSVEQTGEDGVRIDAAASGDGDGGSGATKLDDLDNVDVTGWLEGTFADRPATGDVPDGTRYWATDRNTAYRNTSNGWDVNGGTGTASNPIPEQHVGSFSTGGISNGVLFAGESTSLPPLTDAIQDATGGETIYVVGDYALSADVTLPDGCTLTATGTIDTTAYQIDASNNCVFRDLSMASAGGNKAKKPISVDGVSGVRINNVDINGSNSQGPENLIAINNSSDVVVKDSDLSETFEQAIIDIIASSDVTVKSCNLTDAGREGINVYTDCSNVLVEDCNVLRWMRSNSMPDGGISAYGPGNDGLTVRDCTIDTGSVSYPSNGAKPFRFRGTKNIRTIDNDIIMRSEDNNIGIEVQGRDSYVPDDVTVSGNRWDIQTGALDRVGFILDSTNVTFTDNVYSVDSSVSISEAFIRTSATGSVIFSNESVDNCPANFHRIRGPEHTDVKYSNVTIQSGGEKLSSIYASSAERVIIDSCSIITTNVNAMDVQDGYGYLSISDSYLESSEAPIANASNSNVNTKISNNHEVTT